MILIQNGRYILRVNHVIKQVRYTFECYSIKERTSVTLLMVKILLKKVRYTSDVRYTFDIRYTFHVRYTFQG